MHTFISIMPISSTNLMFDQLLELSFYDSNKWLSIGFGEEITQVVLIEVNPLQPGIQNGRH